MGKFSYAVFGASLLLFSLSAFSAQAAETVQAYPLSGAPSDSIIVDEYSRFNSTIKLALPVTSGKRVAPGTAALQCSGNGTWDVIPDASSGNCWDKFDYIYPEVHAEDLPTLLQRVEDSGYTPRQKQIDTRDGHPIYEVRYTIPEQPIDASQINISPYTKCTGGQIQSVTSPTGASVKRHCIFDDAGATIIGNTGDDMFKIKPDASAYMEYIDVGGISSSDRLKWIERSGGGVDIMMPSGPASTFQDYKDFLRNKPSSISKIESACYAVTATLCGAPMPAKAPPAPGYCGAANRQMFPSIAAINAIPYGRCYVGTPTSITEVKSGDTTTFKWRCRSDPVGAAADTQCSAPKVVDGKCGGANAGSYNTAAQVNAAGLCEFGNPSRVPAGPGSWSWSCSANGAGGKTSHCMASTKASADSCDAMAYEGALVLVQDLSGSYGDDLPNLLTNMTGLVNDPDFKSWKIGVTSFMDVDSGDGDYGYRKDLDLQDVSTSKASILSAINGFTLGNGGDGPESQYLAVNSAVGDFRGQTTLPLNIILATDATSHPHVSEATVAATLKNAGASLTVLATGSEAASFYSSFLSTYGIPGSVVNLAADSSNFRTAVKAGLSNSYCSSPSSVLGCGSLNSIACASSNLGDTCRSSAMVPNNHFTYMDEDGRRSIYQCRDQALFFFRED